jgi:LEM3 (ligand-effect modulator 3) family / CDC50 family
VSSRDDDQLNGASEPTANSLSSSCAPYRGYYNNSGDSGIPYAPCGSIANSLFNGEFFLFCIVYLIEEVFGNTTYVRFTIVFVFQVVLRVTRRRN